MAVEIFLECAGRAKRRRRFGLDQCQKPDRKGSVALANARASDTDPIQRTRIVRTVH
jgi:hypothetical protein